MRKYALKVLDSKHGLLKEFPLRNAKPVCPSCSLFSECIDRKAAELLGIEIVKCDVYSRVNRRQQK